MKAKETDKQKAKEIGFEIIKISCIDTVKDVVVFWEQNETVLKKYKISKQKETLIVDKINYLLKNLNKQMLVDILAFVNKFLDLYNDVDFGKINIFQDLIEMKIDELEQHP